MFLKPVKNIDPHAVNLINTHLANASDPHGTILNQTTLNVANLNVSSTNGLVLSSSSTYAFCRDGDLTTGLYFDVVTGEFQFHNAGVVKAKIDANNGDVTAAGVLAGPDGITAPGATVGVFKLYVDSADGDLKVVFGDGTVKTIAVDT